MFSEDSGDSTLWITEVAWERTAAEEGGAITPDPIEVTMRGDSFLQLV